MMTSTAGPMIGVRDLHVAFGHGAEKVKAVDGVSFEVAEKESFGVVGESGSGKSTVLRALSGLNPDWSGGIVVDGRTQGRRRDKAFHKTCQDRKSTRLNSSH